MVAEAARRTLRDAGLADRADIVAASIFDELPEGADVYVLKFVLHSLDDPDAVEALRRCAAAVAPGGRILVIERSLFPGDDATGFTSMDLRMLILGGGRERTIGEFEALGAEAGLTLGSARATPAGPHLLEFSVR